MYEADKAYLLSKSTNGSLYSNDNILIAMQGRTNLSEVVAFLATLNVKQV